MQSDYFFQWSNFQTSEQIRCSFFLIEEKFSQKKRFIFDEVPWKNLSKYSYSSRIDGVRSNVSSISMFRNKTNQVNSSFLFNKYQWIFSPAIRLFIEINRIYRDIEYICDRHHYWDISIESRDNSVFFSDDWKWLRNSVKRSIEIEFLTLMQTEKFYCYSEE